MSPRPARVLRPVQPALLALVVCAAAACSDASAAPADAAVQSGDGGGDAGAKVPCRRPYELDTLLSPTDVGAALALTPTGEGLLVMTDERFLLLSPDGTETERARITRSDARAARLDSWPVAFAGERAFTVVERGAELRLLEVDLAAGTSRELAPLPELPPALVWSGERLVWTEPGDAGALHGQRIVALDPRTSERAELRVEVGSFAVELAVLAADTDDLIVDVSLPVGVSQPDPAVLAVPGIYRVSQADGASEQLVAGGGVALDLFDLFGAGARSEAHYGAGAAYIRTGSVDYARFYAAPAGAAAQQVSCLELDERWVAAFSVQGRALSIALSDGSEVSVVQYAP